ncbi:MAG: glutamine synthetase family protein [Actinomycetales bacterium]|nr:glutamine synthetase family protein [Actinomycetales bacterium]
MSAGHGWAQGERDRVAALCEEHGIHTVECMLVDTWGMPRGKRVPVRQFLRGSGFHIANVIYTWDPTCFIFPTPWVDEEDGFPDMHALPDLSTFRVAGWADGVAAVICDAYDNATGEPVAMDSRHMLKRQLARAAELGYGVDAATELECHFFTAEWRPLYDDINCYSIYRGYEMEPFMLDIRESLRRTGIEVEATNVEYGPGQTEINLRYGPMMEMADHTVYFKYIVRLVAKRHGLNVTFMAKPFLLEAGNGMHVHQSLTVDGRNAFAVADEDSVLGNALMRRYLTGLLAHHKELQLVMTPTISGYKRVQDYSFSPTQVTWGLDHRLVGVRSIVGAGAGNRLEARWAAADANPYLVLAGCLAAGLDGLEHDYPLMAQVVGDPHADASWERLPTDITGAIANFDTAFNRSVFGDDFVENFIFMQQREAQEFATHADTSQDISDWEIARYRAVI